MWEALDKWPREATIRALTKLVGLPWQAREMKSNCSWESETIANVYWTTYENIEILIYVPTEHMTNNIKPHLKLTSSNNVQVVITQKEEESVQFRRLIGAVDNIAIWDLPTVLMQEITLA